MRYIFYGAGRYAEANIEIWKSGPKAPVCFADADENKWHKKIGGYEILSLQEALQKYPDSNIVITVNHKFGEIYDYIVSLGISEERIQFIIPREKRLGCRFLGKFWQFDGGRRCKPCCFEKSYDLDIDDSFEECRKAFQAQNKRIIDGLRDLKPTTCDGCPELMEDWWEVEPRLESISFAIGFKGDLCNAKCIYCDADSFLRSASDSNMSILDVCESLAESDEQGKIILTFNNAEFTVNPYRREVMKLWKTKGWYGHVLTNGIVFSPELAELMKSGLADLNCSLDAGTEETFKKIKGVNKFLTVCDNLRKYAGNGLVTLKYIILKNVNDNLKDISGFIHFAEELRADVIVSRDIYNRSQQMTEKEYELYHYFIWECKKRNLKISLPMDVFNEQDYFAIKEMIQ